MMNAAASGLKDLHQLHIQLRQVRDQLDRGPKQVRARKQFMETKQAELEAARNQLKQLKVAADQKSLQLRVNETKILDLKSKLNQASSNREYDVFRSQIDADTMANSVLEDEILEALEKVDAMQVRVGEAEKAVAAADAEHRRMAEQIGNVEPDLLRQAGELEQTLKEAERDLPAAIVENYRRLVQAHGADALAAIENKACGACNAIIAANMVVEINTGKIQFCRSCGRMLYRAEPA